MSFSEIKFQDFITLQRGFDLPVTKMKEGDVPVLGSNSIVGYHNEAKVEPPGVVTGRSGTLGMVQFTDKPFWPHNTSLWVKDFKGNDPKFVFYKLQTLKLDRFNGGASVPTLNRNVLDTLKTSIPGIDEQKKIGSILYTYDTLIENNRRRIQLLEQSARLLYREWFVHLRFPGHEHVRIIDGVPEGWEKSTVGEKVVLNYGKALNADDRIEGSYPVYGSSGVIGTHEKPLVKGPGIIVGRKGNVGSVFWSHKDFYPIDTVYFIDSKTTNYYLYHTLQNMQFINSDGAVPGLNRNFAYSRPYIIPEHKLLFLFEENVSPIHIQIHKLAEYNKKLIEARDILLPRLMNGEIAV